MCEETLSLYKELTKSLQEGFSIVDNAFESALKKVKYFYLTGPISRDRVRLNKFIKDRHVVYLEE